MKKEHLYGTKTVRGTDFEKLDNLQVEGVSVIAPDHEIKKLLWDYSYYTATITDHDQNIYEGFMINQGYEATYKVDIFDQKKQHVKALIVEVGARKIFQDNLAYGSRVLGTSIKEPNQKNRVKTLFNNKIEEQYYEQVITEENHAWFAFDIGSGAVARSWELYNNTAKHDGREAFNAKAAKVEVLLDQDPTEKELSSFAYLNDDKNWKQVGEFTDGGKEAKLTGDLDDLDAKYWRIHVTEKTGTEWGTAISVLEFKIFGERDYKIALRDLINSTVMVETVGMDETSVQNYEAAKAEAEQVLVTDFENETALKEAMAKLQQAINDIKEAVPTVDRSDEWVKEGNDYYYYDENGQLLRSAMTPDGYRVNADGKWVKGSWKQNKTGWWYEYEDGYYLSNTWKKIGRFWYHFKTGGYMSASTWVGSKAEGYYYVNKDGQMLTSTVTPDGYTVDKNGKWDTSIPQIKR